MNRSSETRMWRRSSRSIRSFNRSTTSMRGVRHRWMVQRLANTDIGLRIMDGASRKRILLTLNLTRNRSWNQLCFLLTRSSTQSGCMALGINGLISIRSTESTLKSISYLTATGSAQQWSRLTSNFLTIRSQQASCIEGDSPHSMKLRQYSTNKKRWRV